MQKAREIISLQRYLWTNYDADVCLLLLLFEEKQTYMIANAFCSRMEPKSHGITTWGFAILTKSLALTVWIHCSVPLSDSLAHHNLRHATNAVSAKQPERGKDKSHQRPDQQTIGST